MTSARANIAEAKTAVHKDAEAKFAKNLNLLKVRMLELVGQREGSKKVMRKHTQEKCTL